MLHVLFCSHNHWSGSWVFFRWIWVIFHLHDCGGKGNQQLVNYDHEVWGSINSICGCWLWPRKHSKLSWCFLLTMRPSQLSTLYLQLENTSEKRVTFFHIGLFDKNYRLVMKHELIHHAAKSLPIILLVLVLYLYIYINIFIQTHPSTFANPPKKPILLPPTATIAHYLGGNRVQVRVLSMVCTHGILSWS